MNLYTVKVTLETLMVVEADSEDHAAEVAHEYADEAFNDTENYPEMLVQGEVTRLDQLTDGWDGACLPYGGNGATRIREILK